MTQQEKETLLSILKEYQENKSDAIFTTAFLEFVFEYLFEDTDRMQTVWYLKEMMFEWKIKSIDELQTNLEERRNKQVKRYERMMKMSPDELAIEKKEIEQRLAKYALNHNIKRSETEN